MTPEELPKIRAFATRGLCGCWLEDQALALCDALEQAWAEREAISRDFDSANGAFLDMRARARRAERARAERDVNEAAARALARVLEYAEEIDGGILAPVAREIRAAIEGNDR